MKEEPSEIPSVDNGIASDGDSFDFHPCDLCRRIENDPGLFRAECSTTPTPLGTIGSFYEGGRGSMFIVKEDGDNGAK